ncbi:citrate/2-methylcitrate synthase [Microbacterium rhizomatis]|nr:citrate/2-methylcitrate synthase [Microbacterium rhizomatis]
MLIESTPLPRLSTAQVASRLKIKRETLYAYVARGLLVSEPSEDGGSTFDPLDVEAFAASRHRRAAPDEGRATLGKPLMVLESDLASIQDDELYFRGRPATDIARRLPFEDAARFLWAGSAPHDDLDDRFVSRPDVVSAVRRAAASLGPATRTIDQLPLAVAICGSWDPVRDATGPAAVRDAGRHMIATMVDSLPALGAPAAPDASLAERLWPALSPSPATSQHLRLLDATMVLCMEHDLALSTMAARVSASARANPYSAVTAALSSFDSAMHGGASIPASIMIEETIRTGNAEHALARQLSETGLIPGFGHVVYRHEDPRARFLLDAMRPAPGFAPALRAADRLIAVVSARSPRPLNLDLALASLIVGAEMRRDAGELVFAVSRTAGWIAHIIDEYSRPALRLRPQSRYTGPRIPSRR